MIGDDSKARVGIVDYGMGNLFSVAQALRHVGLDPQIHDSPDAVTQWDAIVIPGVGAMPNAMENLRRTGWDDAIREHAQSGRPTFGICLGMQLLFETGSEHSDHPGMGLVPGRVVRMAEHHRSGEKILVPHIGWNTVIEKTAWDRSVLRGTATGTPFYFVHSYVCVPERDEHVLAITEYGGFRFCSAVRSGMIMGCQFHPERSGPAGLRVFMEFRRLVEQVTTVQL
jgi:imidazole glycerol-phosphate synthase subunit HisH